MRRAGHQPNPKMQPSANDGGGSIGLLRCQVPGCGGYMHQDTDGNGRAIEWCTDCEARIAQVRALQSAKRVVREVPVEAPPREIRVPYRVEVIREVVRAQPVSGDELVKFEALLRERCATPKQILREYPTISRTLLFKAIERGKVKAISMGDRVVLVYRQSVQRWRENVRPWCPKKNGAPGVGSVSDERAVLAAPHSQPILTELASSPEPLGDQVA